VHLSTSSHSPPTSQGTSLASSSGHDGTHMDVES
jgi:hypothetical protein